MLFTYKFVEKHNAYKLQEYISAFFDTIKDLDSSTPFSDNLFEKGFRSVLNQQNKDKEQTLRKYFMSFYNKYVSLSSNEKDLVIRIFNEINQNIEKLCSDTSISIFSLSASIKDESKTVFEYLYKNTLKRQEFDIQEHYTEFYRINGGDICGFCGIDTIVAPKIETKEYTQDYDHLLDIATFPFAGINFKNIVPCCEKCNRKFKHTQKILLNDKGTRRKAFYPYLKQADLHRIEIQNLVLPKSVLDKNTDWNLSFAPYNHNQTEEINTWLSVYKIKGRYNEELNKSYQYYDKLLIQHLRSLHKRKKFENIVELKSSVEKYRKTLYLNKYQDKNFLKIAYIDCVLKQKDSYFTSLMKRLP